MFFSFHREVTVLLSHHVSSGVLTVTISSSVSDMPGSRQGKETREEPRHLLRIKVMADITAKKGGPRGPGPSALLESLLFTLAVRALVPGMREVETGSWLKGE